MKVPRRETVIIGGMPVDVVDRFAAASAIISAAHARRRTRNGRPLYFTSVNGEVIARAFIQPAIAALFEDADQIVADGQPLVVASRVICRRSLPERVATTDLFHDVAKLAEKGGETFYLFGASKSENVRAVAAVRAAYPALRIVGHSHGYLTGEALESTLAVINRLAPDILWVGLGVPREQQFIIEHAAKLNNVGVIKTSGGLFNHLSGRNPRAPRWMQRVCLEWLWRAGLEPRRLGWRYLTTNPIALYAILRFSR